MADGRNDKSIPTLGTELWEMLLAYLKQETLEPIKGLARFVALGMAGAFAFALGFVLLMIAGLRALQSETGEHFTGSLTWLPYAIVFGVAIIVAVAFGRAIGAKKRRSAATRSDKGTSA